MKGVDKTGTLKSDRLNACVQFSEPRIGSLKSDRVNGPLHHSAQFVRTVTIILPLLVLHGFSFYYLIEDPVITSPSGGGPKVYEKNEGDFLMLNCSATGRPLPTITWEHRDTGAIIATGTGSKSLIFDSLSRTNHSHYTCTARNNGEASYTATIIVNCKLLGAFSLFH